jgi:hypothetical protein
VRLRNSAGRACTSANRIPVMDRASCQGTVLSQAQLTAHRDKLRFNARCWRGQKCLPCTAGLVEDGSAESSRVRSWAGMTARVFGRMGIRNGVSIAPGGDWS